MGENRTESPNISTIMELCIRSSTIKQTIEIKVNFQALDEKYENGVLKVQRKFENPQSMDFCPMIEIIHDLNQAPVGPKCIRIGMKNVKFLHCDFGDPDCPVPEAAGFEYTETFQREIHGVMEQSNETRYHGSGIETIPRDDNGITYFGCKLINEAGRKI